MQVFDLGVIRDRRILLLPVEDIYFINNCINYDWKPGSFNAHGYSYDQLRVGVETLKRVVLPMLLRGEAINSGIASPPNRDFNWLDPKSIADSYFGSDAIAIAGFSEGGPDLLNGRHRIQCARDIGLTYVPVRWSSTTTVPASILPWMSVSDTTRRKVFAGLNNIESPRLSINLQIDQLKGIFKMTTSAEEQISLLEELKNYLNTFQDRLQGVSDSYQNKVDALDGSLMQNIHTKFLEEELEPARALISKLCDLINESSLPAVQKRIEQLENILNDQ